MRSLKLILIPLLLWGCGQDTEEKHLPDHVRELENLKVISTPNESRDELNLVEIARYGETDEVYLGHLSNVLVDQTGRVYLMDSGWGFRGIKVYAPDGSYIKTMGGKGKGPGEFMDIYSSGIRANTLYLFDGDLDRINFYNLDKMEFSHSMLINPRQWNSIEELESSHPSDVILREDGKLLVGFIDALNLDEPGGPRQMRYYLLNREGEIISGKLLQLDYWHNIYSGRSGHYSAFDLEHQRKSLIDIDTKDRLITAWSEEFFIKKYDQKGAYLEALYYPYERIPIELEQLLNKLAKSWGRNSDGYKHLSKLYRNAELPDHWPALKHMLVDDQNRIWVATVINYWESFKWWILGESGELRATFTLPQTHTVEVVQNDFAYILYEEGGGEEVIKYRIGEVNQITP